MYILLQLPHSTFLLHCLVELKLFVIFVLQLSISSSNTHTQCPGQAETICTSMQFCYVTLIISSIQVNTSKRFGGHGKKAYKKINVERIVSNDLGK